MVVDTSAILALLFAEKHGSWVGEQLDDHAGELCMSTVNLTETLILIRDRQPALADELTETVLTSGLRFVCPDTAQAETAARARLTYPLNLGDCFAYALAVAEDDSILALDRDFGATDRLVLMPPNF